MDTLNYLLRRKWILESGKQGNLKNINPEHLETKMMFNYENPVTIRRVIDKPDTNALCNGYEIKYYFEHNCYKKKIYLIEQSQDQTWEAISKKIEFTSNPDNNASVSNCKKNGLLN